MSTQGEGSTSGSSEQCQLSTAGSSRDSNDQLMVLMEEMRHLPEDVKASREEARQATQTAHSKYTHSVKTETRTNSSSTKMSRNSSLMSRCTWEKSSTLNWEEAVDRLELGWVVVEEFDDDLTDDSDGEKRMERAGEESSNEKESGRK
ncbi:hypothetical protein EMCRGX_G029137 [Ephydatia muelleri]